MAKERDDETRSVEASQGAPQFSGETPGEVVSEVRGYLKAMTSIISREPPPPSPHLEPGLEGMRGLVGIARELAKGPSANRVIVDNVELLKTRYVELLSGATTSPATPSASQEASPLAGSREASMAERRPADPIVQHSRPALKPATTVPAFELDRRYVQRPASSQPLFSAISNEYLAARRTKSGDGNADIETARFRRDLFIELIGDHPVDTYSGTDLQAYVALLKYWPASVKEAPFGS